MTFNEHYIVLNVTSRDFLKKKNRHVDCNNLKMYIKYFKKKFIQNLSF